jgi:transposase InsO family protein
MDFVVRWSKEEGNFAALCREFGISRKTGYKWLSRFESERAKGLEDREPIAGSCPHRTPDEVADKIVLARKAHPTWGPRKLRAWIADREPGVELPATSTIGDLLRSRGLVRPRRRRLRVPIERLPLAPCGGPNEVWSADFKGHFALGDRKRCYPLTILDTYSRYFLKCEALLEPKEGPVREQFELAFREFGLPLRIRTDNGAPFASTAIGGLTGLAVWWIKLGIVPERIEPGHPEQNGCLERLHRTLKAEATKPAGADATVQQRTFDRFRHEYNDERPHESIGDRPPARVYALSLRPYPATPSSPEYEPEWTVRSVDDHGRVSFAGKCVKLVRCLAGEPVGLREVNDGCFQLRYGPLTLGVLDVRGKEPKIGAMPPKSPVTGDGTLVAGYQGAAPATLPVAPVTLQPSLCDVTPQTLSVESPNL